VMPAVVIAPAVIVWAISRFTSRQAPYWVAATLALVFGAASIPKTATAFADERALRERNGKAIDEVVARYQNPVVIGAYRAGYQSWAVQFGLGSVGRKFAKSIPGATADDKLGYFAPLDKLLRHYIDAVEWSYLDQFERAGRPILVVLPRGTRIDPQTAQTETLLDQGFGDIVERIIVTPQRAVK
jgi:hypothetical protein